jgi:hypothetical protein
VTELSVPGGPFGITSLWQACSYYVKCNQDCVYDSQIGKAWCQAIAEGAAVGGYMTNKSSADTNFESYLVCI